MYSSLYEEYAVPSMSFCLVTNECSTQVVYRSVVPNLPDALMKGDNIALAVFPNGQQVVDSRHVVVTQGVTQLKGIFQTYRPNFQYSVSYLWPPQVLLLL